MHYLEDITEAMDNGNDVDVITWTSVKHLIRYHIEGCYKNWKKYGKKEKRLFNWMKDFLSDRLQTVFIKGSSSTWTDITSGVPQGSVLVTTLFLVYIYDLPEAVDVLVKIFADETKVYRVIESADTPELLQNDVGKSEYLDSEWKMLYNTEKCHHVGVNTKASEYEMGSGD